MENFQGNRFVYWRNLNILFLWFILWHFYGKYPLIIEFEGKRRKWKTNHSNICTGKESVGFCLWQQEDGIPMLGHLQGMKQKDGMEFHAKRSSIQWSSNTRPLKDLQNLKLDNQQNWIKSFLNFFVFISVPNQALSVRGKNWKPFENFRKNAFSANDKKDLQQMRRYCTKSLSRYFLSDQKDRTFIFTGHSFETMKQGTISTQFMEIAPLS